METAIIKAVEILGHHEDWNTQYMWVFLLVVVIYPLCQFNVIGALRYSSIITFASVIFITVVTIVEVDGDTSSIPTAPTSWTNCFFSVPIVLFAYTCQPNVGDIYKVRDS